MAADQSLSLEIKDDELVIRIGVSALAVAALGGNYMESMDDAEITDERAFAASILAELEREDEVGTNLVYAAIDQAVERAIEAGDCDGIDFSD